MKRKIKGQAALIMIVVLAIGFIFYAIEINWGRISNWKMTTWMAATNASSQVASGFASYGERVVWENLLLHYGNDVDYEGGNLEHSEDTLGLFLEILVIIVVVIIMVLAHQYWLVTVIVAVVMVISLILEYCVTRPNMFAMWNKLQQNLTSSNQFQEQGIMTGLQGIATDSAVIPDRFDWDANGRWGFNGKVPKDEIGRFSLFYTERLKLIKPPDSSAYDAFRDAINNLLTKPYSSDPTAMSGLGFNAYCNAGNQASPQCDPQCTGIPNRPSKGTNKNIGLGWQFSEATGKVQYVPAQCLSACSSEPDGGVDCPPVVDSRPLLYDPALEIPPVPSPDDPTDQKYAFRYRLGHDDEIGKSLNFDATGTTFDTTNAPITGSTEPGYDPTHPTGIVFPMLNEMITLGNDIALGQNNGLPNPDLSVIAQKLPSIPPSIDTADFKDTANFIAKNDDCAESKDSKSGFYWKKGADRYCSASETDPMYSTEAQKFMSQYNVKGNNIFSTESNPNHWPYYDCPYMHNGSSKLSCTTAPDHTLWPQDRLDAFVYKLSDLINFNKFLQGFDSKSLSTSSNQWYSQALQYIAPQCKASACSANVTVCKNNCNGDASCESSCTCTPSNYSSPLDQSVSATIMPFASDGSACNPSQQGAMIQWVYDLKNWSDKIDQWLKTTYPAQATDLCKTGGTLKDIADCLDKNRTYTDELLACQKVFPPSYSVTTTVGGVTTVTNPMPAACVDVIRLEQKDTTIPAAFFSHFPDYSTLATDATVTGIVPTAPPDDTTLLTTPYATNVNTYAIIKTWLADNIVLKNAISKRYAHVNDLKMNAEGTSKLFKEGAQDFNNFLEGPGLILMTAQSETGDLSIKRLPGFAIYGWKDNRPHLINGVKRGGMWHLARMEVRAPKKMPWIHSWEDVGFFITTIHYQFTDGNHDVITRATRWNEDIVGGTSNFANKIPIWSFVFGNPKPPSGWNDGTFPQPVIVGTEGEMLERDCIGITSPGSPWGKINGKDGGIGITSGTKSSISKNGLISGFTKDEIKQYQGAFMLDLDPRLTIPPDRPYIDGCTVSNCQNNNWNCCQSTKGYFGASWSTYCTSVNKAICAANTNNQMLRDFKDQQKQCFATADYLLNKGVQSTVAARYGIPPLGSIDPTIRQYHEQITFYSPLASESGKGTLNGRPHNIEFAPFSRTHTIKDTDLGN